PAVGRELRRREGLVFRVLCSCICGDGGSNGLARVGKNRRVCPTILPGEDQLEGDEHDRDRKSTRGEKQVEHEDIDYNRGKDDQAKRDKDSAQQQGPGYNFRRRQQWYEISRPE